MALFDKISQSLLVFILLIHSNHGDEESIQPNPLEYSKDLFEGDIKGMTKELFQEYLTKDNQIFEDDIRRIQEDPSRLIQHNAIRSPEVKWPGGIVPYKIASYFTEVEKQKILGAILEYHEKTCIRFVPYTNQKRYLYIQSLDGCWSGIGRGWGDGPKDVSINKRGCMWHGTIVHELMHSLGFFHEQSRADRDDWVIVHLHNIIRGLKGQFEKYDLKRITHLGAPYDYGSIMHYHDKAFSYNGRAKTITKRRPGPEIGQRDGLSYWDLFKINKLYDCPVRPSPPPKPEVRPGPEGQQCRILKGVRWFHKDVARAVPVPSFGRCCELCTDHEGCEMWTWRRDTQECWFKSGTGSGAMVPIPDSIVSGWKGKSKTKPPTTSQCGLIQRNRANRGNPIANGHKETISDCCNWCAATENCKGYSYNAESWCWLHHTAINGEYVLRGSFLGRMNRRSNPTPSGCRSEVTNDRANRGNPIANVHKENVEDCCKWCKEMENCAGYSFDANSWCWLHHSAITGEYDLPGSKLGKMPGFH